jgi:two-component system cell cycle sensor histidine kinase/response regulator CckA
MGEGEQTMRPSDVQQLHEQLLASVGGVTWELDVESLRLTFLGTRAEQLLGYPSRRWREPGFWMERMHSDDREWALRMCTLPVPEPAECHRVYRMIAADGSTAWMRNLATIVVEREGAARLCGIVVDVTESKLAEREHDAHLWFLESMDRVNRAIQGASGPEDMMRDVLDEVLEILDCDRAWLLYPCDPDALSWSIPMERTRPEFPGAAAMGVEPPMDEEIVGVIRALLESEGPLQFGPGAAHRIPVSVASGFGVRRFIAMVIRPRVDEGPFVRMDKPWVFGIHQCTHDRRWTSEQERVFRDIGWRLADGLTNFLMLQGLRSNQARLEEAERVAHLGYWEAELGSGRVTCSAETHRILGSPGRSGFLELGRLEGMVHTDDRPRVCEAFEALVGEGALVDVEFHLEKPGGELRCVHVRGHVMRNASGRPLRAFGTVQDITERKRAEEELRSAKRQLETLVEHFPDFLARFDREGRFLYLNPAACRAFGLTLDEVVGKTLHDLEKASPPGQNDALRAGVDRAFAEGRTNTLEVSWFTVSGERLFEVRHVPELDEQGRVVSVMGITRDITDQRRAEERLRLFRSLIDHINDTVEVIDPESGRFLDVNEQACHVHGYTREEYLALAVQDVDPMFTTRSWKEVVEDVRQSGSRLLESKHLRKDGSSFPVEINATYIRLDSDYLLAVVRDITERQRAQQALVESHNLLHAVIEGTDDFVFVKDLQGRYLMMNAAGARALGRTVDEVVGKEDWDLFPREIVGEIIERDHRVMGTGVSEVFEESPMGGGSTRTLLTTKGVYRDVQGEVIGLIGISRDITELKHLEQQLVQAQKMDAVGRLAGGVAHDFNNLLTVVNGYCEMVFDDLPSSDPNRELLAEVLRCGERAATLTRQLLAFSRKQVLQPRAIVVNELLEESVKLLQRLIGEDVQLELHLERGLGCVEVDPGQFEQAIVNLAVNARDAMPRGGHLAIVTRCARLGRDYTRLPEVSPGRYVVVEVSDTGEGMDEATAARVFEPFFTTKEQGKGTGLGLAMVYGFVKQSGGHIELESTPGQGTTFRIYLPEVGEPASADRRPAEPEGVANGTETVLLVEDEDAVRGMLRLVLRVRGYTVLEARDGYEAVRIARQHTGPIHLLLTDLVMPRMGGRELADELARTKPGLQVLFMSGHSDEAIGRHGALESGVAFLQKPFSAMDLARKVREVLDVAKAR